MVEILRVDTPHALAAARALIRAHLEAVHSESHHSAVTAAVLAALPEPYVAPAGGLWLAWDGPEAAGCVALHALAPGIAELKRMYVQPASRGRGVARALAQHAILEAQFLGYERLRLGTLPHQHAAQQLYTSLGFRLTAPYRDGEFGRTLFYELEIDAPAI